MSGQTQRPPTARVTIVHTAAAAQRLVDLPVSSSGLTDDAMYMVGHDPAYPNEFTIYRVFGQSNGTPK